MQCFADSIFISDPISTEELIKVLQINVCTFVTLTLSCTIRDANFREHRNIYRYKQKL